jgi:ABC-2 type transport system ATP-binding protein
MTPAISLRVYPGVTVARSHWTTSTSRSGRGRSPGCSGRNGAGKTTLMRIIAGQELTTAGTVRVFGSDPVHDEDVLRRVVFVREDQAFPDFQVRQLYRRTRGAFLVGTVSSPTSSCPISTFLSTVV